VRLDVIASVPPVAVLRAAFGIPPEGIGIILGVERLLDMTRTTVNVGSDVVTTMVVDRFTRLGGQASGGSAIA
jgi:DAACS family dicarboxylate/amino acid:cation (Na+ or H+) symporter